MRPFGEFSDPTREMSKQQSGNRRKFLQASAFGPATLLWRNGLSAIQGSRKAGTAAPSFGSILDIEHIKVGHYTEPRRPTGCTVVLFEKGGVAGVDVRGSAPGTRETDLLSPLGTVEKIHAILLAGGKRLWIRRRLRGDAVFGRAGNRL